MPIPFIIGGLAALAGAAGIGGHINAKELNEEAQRVADNAKALYDNAKCSLDMARNNTEYAINNLAEKKKNILNTSFPVFLDAYNKLKTLNFKNNLNELDNIYQLDFTPQDMLQIQEMKNIYDTAAQNVIAGVAGGALVTVAAGGSLAGAASLTAIASPLAVIAAPAILFTGISASMKAEENLSKANQQYAEAELASEEMKTKEIFFNGITAKTEMFNELICNLDSIFSKCAALLDRIVKSKTDRLKRQLNSDDFSEEEVNFFFATRTLAGALKKAIEVPLFVNGEVPYDVNDKYNELSKQLPTLTAEVENSLAQINVSDYAIAEEKVKKSAKKPKVKSSAPSHLPEAARNVFALLISAMIAYYSYDRLNMISAALLSFSFPYLLISKADNRYKLFKGIRYISMAGIAGGCGILLYSYSLWFIGLFSMKYFIIGDIVGGIVCLVIFGLTFDVDNNIVRIISSIALIAVLSAIAFLLLCILYFWLEFPFKATIIVIDVLYVLCVMTSLTMFEPENQKSIV